MRNTVKIDGRSIGVTKFRPLQRFIYHSPISRFLYPIVNRLRGETPQTKISRDKLTQKYSHISLHDRD